MKILILANSSTGLWNFRQELIQTLISKGNEVFISLPFGERIEDLKSIGCQLINTNVDRRGIDFIRDFILFFRYLKIIKKIRPDKIITYTIKPNIYSGLCAKILKIPYFVNITGLGTAFQKDNFIKKMVVFLYRRAICDAKTVFFQNQENADIMLKLKIVNTNQICLLNGSGVNLDKYSFSELNKKDTIDFCFVGRVMKEKGIDEFFDAVSKIKNEGYNVSFSIFGGFVENYKDKIDIMVKQGFVNYYGSVKNLEERYKDYDCLVLPSYHEGMSNALLEAASTGRALITSNIHGCMEAVNEGENGFLCEVKNSEALYLCLKRYILLPFEKRVEMGKNSRKLMEEKFDKEKVIQKIIEAVIKK